MKKAPGKKQFVLYFLLYSVPLLLIAGFLSYEIYRQDFNAYYSVMKNNERQVLQFQKLLIREHLKDLANDVTYLADLGSTRQYVRSGFSNSTGITEDYTELLKRRGIYTAARIIDSGGFERFRLNYAMGYVSPVQRGSLQAKGDRYYVQEIMNTSPDRVYFSRLDFNRENGSLEIPYKPVLRVARLILDRKGSKRAFVILTYNGRKLLDLMESISLYSYGKIFLINSSGTLISLDEVHSREKETIITFMRSKEGRKYMRKPPKELRINSGFLTCGTIKVSDEAYGPSWKIISFVGNGTIHVGAAAAMHKSLLFFSIIGIVSVLLSLLLAWSRFRRIKTVRIIQERARIFDFNPAPVMKVSTDGKILSSNTAAKTILGLTVQPLTLTYGFHALPEDDRSRILSEETCSFEYPVRNRRYYFVTRKDSESMHIFIYGMDITENSRIREELEKFKVAVQQSANDIVFTNLEGRIIYVNSGFEHITGYTRDEALGKTPRVLNSGYHSKSFYRELWETITGGSVWKGEMRNRRKDGTLFWEKATITPIVDGMGMPRFYIAVKEDITEKKRIENDLRLQTEYARQALEEAKTADRLKSSFLANMSHEIRTPLNAVLGFTQILLGRSLDPKSREMVEIIQTSGKSLLELINDILDFSKIEADEITIVKEQIRLFPFFDDLRRLFQHQTAAKGLLFSVSPDSRVPTVVFGDETRIRQILVNIIGNAVKFTDRGSISVSVTWEDDSLRVTVSDTGMGMSKEELEEIFSPFKQSDASITRKFGGTGLGLAISRRLTLLMGGTLEVSSMVDKGSTFTLRLPLDRQAEDSGDSGIRGEIMVERWLNSAENEQIYQIIKSAVTLLPGYLDRLDREVRTGDRSAVRACAHEYAGSFGNLGMGELYELMKNLDDGIRNSTLDEEGIQKIVVTFKEIVHSIPPSFLEETGSEAPVPAGKSPVSILTAEDNDSNRKLIREMLSRLSVDTDFAENGYEVLELLEKKRYDILLLDIQMPKLDGLETVRRIRKLEKCENLYVIAVTAQVMKGDRERYLESGCNDVISKPIQQEQFLHKIRALMERGVYTMPEAEFAECLQQLEEAVSIYNPKKVRKVAGQLEQYPLGGEIAEIVRALYRSADTFDSEALPELIAALKGMREKGEHVPF